MEPHPLLGAEEEAVVVQSTEVAVAVVLASTAQALMELRVIVRMGLKMQVPEVEVQAEQAAHSILAVDMVEAVAPLVARTAGRVAAVAAQLELYGVLEDIHQQIQQTYKLYKEKIKWNYILK
jgi:hypothetical protein